MPSTLLRDTTAEAEARLARAGVAWSERPQRGRLEVRGRDRVAFLNGQSSSDVKALAPGQGQATTFLSGKGKMRGRGELYALPDRFWLLVDEGSAERVKAHLETYIVMDDVEVLDRGAETREFLVHGPGAAAEAARLLAEPRLVGLAEHGVLEAAGGGWMLARERPTGEEGVVVVVPAAAGAELRARLAAELPEVHAEALEILRVEAGRPRFGVDLDEDTIPVEALLFDHISYTKGCFTGNEVLARIKTYGHVNRELRGLVLDAAAGVRGGSVEQAGKPVGRITSAVWSPALERPIALAFLRQEALLPGGEVSVGEGAERAAATVVDLPFVRSEKP